jgi:UDP-N-acetylglucosamine 2-epimerase (non-hydrolysing)
MMKSVNVVGARPNFIKIAPVMEELRHHREFLPILLHTGQHYDANVSRRFSDELDIPDRTSIGKLALAPTPRK